MRRGLLLIGILSVGLTACAPPITGVRGSGSLTTEVREVSGFDAIDLRGSGKVVVTLGNSESLTIEAEDNLLEFLVSDVEGTTLRLGTTRNVFPTEDITYTISAVSLVRLQLSGSGDIGATGVESDTFDLNLDGSGEISLQGDFDTLKVDLGGSGAVTASGTASHLEVRVSGSGSFNGEAMLSETGDVSLSGSGGLIVNVSDSLTADLSGSGNIQYVGTPSLDASTAGSGSIRQR